jgi:prolipoprotein diacylglyceryltransferase
MASVDRMTIWGAAGLAVFLQPWTLVAAGAATVVAAKLSTAADYVTLMLFCLLGTASFLYLELYAVFRPAAATARLDRMRGWLDTHQDQIIIVVFLLLGFWLAGKSIYLLVS